MSRNRMLRHISTLAIVLCLPGLAGAGLIWHSALDGDATAIIGSDGVATGTPTAVPDLGGNPDGAVLFGGQSDRDYYTIAPAIASASAASISFWARPDTVDTSEDGVVAVGASGGGSDVYFTVMNRNDRRWRVDLDDGGNRRDAVSNAAPVAGTWYHMVVTFDSNPGSSEQLRMYIDGLLEGDVQSIGGDAAPYTFTHPWLIGSERTGERFFNGAVDDVRVYDHELTQSEVLDLYESGPLYDATIIPEPCTMVLALLGLAGLRARRRRRRG